MGAHENILLFSPAPESSNMHFLSSPAAKKHDELNISVQSADDATSGDIALGSAEERNTPAQPCESLIALDTVIQSITTPRQLVHSDDEPFADPAAMENEHVRILTPNDIAETPTSTADKWQATISFPET